MINASNSQRVYKVRRNIAGQSNEAVIQWIRDDSIDLLIDLSCHTDRNRLLVFARKTVPLQVTWLGYFDTTAK